MGVTSMRGCQALLIFGLVAALPAPARAQDNPLGECRTRNTVTQTGVAVTEDGKGLRVGNVRVVCDESILHADEVRWEGDIVTATGHVLLEDRGLRVSAEKIVVNRTTRLGTFYQVTGWARLGDPEAPPNPFGQLEPDVQFAADTVERVGPREYKLTRGWYSSCAQPVPRWAITHTSGSIVLNERLLAKNAVLKVKGVPVFYMPFIYYPLDADERSTGFLMPQYTTSSWQGQGIGNAFFWAINRSQDATFYHNWYSKAGQSYGVEYRYAAAPGSGGQAQFTVLDNVSEQTERRYIAKASVNQRVNRYMGLVGRMSYTSDQLTQQLYNQNLYDLSNRERYGAVSLSAHRGRYTFMMQGDLRETYQGATFAQRQGLVPAVSLNVGEKPIGRSPIYFGMANEAVSFIRKGDYGGSPDADRTLFRFDTTPTIRAPLSRLRWLQVTTSAALRWTYWTKSEYDQIELRPVSGPIDRQLVELRTELVGPTFEKFWTPTSTGFAERYQHVIQPRVSIGWLSPFDQAVEDTIVRIDHVDTLVSGTTTVDYGLTNRWLARRPRPEGGRGVTRSIFDVTISQRYYTDERAAAFDPFSETTRPSPFSPVNVRANLTPTDIFNARFQMNVDARLLRPILYSAATQLYTGRTQLGVGWTVTPYVEGFNSPESATHFLNWTLTTGTPGGRVHGTYSANLDVRRGSMPQHRIVVSLNAQCCGVTFDYQVLQAAAFGPATIPADRRFGVSFSLAGLGSFSNPFGSFGDNSGRR
jgi:hypothetical protein